MMLGGRRSFSEGGWSGTPVAELLPVSLSPAWSAGVRRRRAVLRRDQRRADHLGQEPPGAPARVDRGSLARGLAAPAEPLDLQPAHPVKPGATNLLVGKGEGLPGEQVVLAYQRYGRGKSLAWSVHDSWHWQMHADIPVEDQTHEILWRQLLRWLVSYVPEPVEVTVASDHGGAGPAGRGAHRGARSRVPSRQQRDVTATVETPSGQTMTVPLDWTVEKDGEYVGGFAAEEEGLYGVRVEAGTRDAVAGRGRALGPGGAARERTLRRAAAPRLARTAGDRDRRPLLRPGQRARRGRRPRVQPRGLDAARAPRPVGHADRLHRAGGAAGAGVGAAAPLGDGLRRRALAAGPGRPRDDRRALRRPRTHLLVISGLGGEESYSKSFHDWSTSLIDSAVASGVPEANVVYLAEDPARDTERIDGAARKETIESTLQKMGASAGAGGELWIVIFGHGSARGDEATVNLPGPDLSGSELAAMIERAAGRAGGDRQRLERECRLRRAAVGARPGDRDRDPQPSPSATRRPSEASSAKGSPTARRRRQGRARVAARSLRLRADRGGARVRGGRSHGDRASDARRQRRPQGFARAQGDRRRGRPARAAGLFLGSDSTAGRELARARPTAGEEERARRQDRGAAAQRSGQDEEVYLRELETLLLDLARTNAEIERLAGAKEKPG